MKTNTIEEPKASQRKKCTQCMFQGICIAERHDKCVEKDNQFLSRADCFARAKKPS